MNDKTTEIMEEAARWSARLCAPDCSDRERQEFERWVRADPAHAQACAAAQLVSDSIGLLARVDPRLRALADEAFAQGASDLPAAARPRRSRRRWTLPVGLAAALALAAIGLRIGSERQTGSDGEVHSAATQTRSITLADGSRVQLDVGTEIRVKLSREARSVTLVSGRALFSVAHNRERPFSVTAGPSRTTALGTVFQVQRESDAVTVTLSEGSVAVDAVGARERREILAPGQQLRVAGADWQRRHVDTEAATSWSQGRLVFRGTPLAEALAEVNRYSSHKLMLGDPGLAGLVVSGSFFVAGDSRAIAAALEAVLPVRALQSGDETLLFRRYDGVGG